MFFSCCLEVVPIFHCFLLSTLSAVNQLENRHRSIIWFEPVEVCKIAFDFARETTLFPAGESVVAAGSPTYWRGGLNWL